MVYQYTYRHLQVDICAEEMGNNVPSHVMLVGHIKAVVMQVRAMYGSVLTECFFNDVAVTSLSASFYC